jgi:hypothetical protein
MKHEPVLIISSVVRKRLMDVRNNVNEFRIEAVTMVNMNIAVFKVVMLYSVIES